MLEHNLERAVAIVGVVVGGVQLSIAVSSVIAAEFAAGSIGFIIIVDASRTASVVGTVAVAEAATATAGVITGGGTIYVVFSQAANWLGKEAPRYQGGSASNGRGGGFRGQAAGNLRRMGLDGINLTNKSFNSGKKLLEKAGFRYRGTTSRGRHEFIHPRTKAEVFYDSGKALVGSQKPHWHIFESGQYFNRSEDRLHVKLMLPIFPQLDKRRKPLC